MQEKREPALTLYDFFMGQLYGELPKRALEDHPIHLQASLVHPFSVELPSSFPSPYNLEQGLFLAWGGREHLHSLFSLSKFDVQREGEAFLCTLTLPETFPQEGPSSVETSLFCNLHEETTVLVNGVRATTFALGDRVSILSQGTKIELTFSGEGIFFGHLSRANRPNQLSNKGDKRFDAYDWQIALRTIRRPATCTLRLHIYA